VADDQSILPYQDLFDQQAQDLLLLAHVQGGGPRPQLRAETAERFRQPQAMRLVGAGGCQRLPFGLQRLLLLAQLRHASTKLFQAYQTFLISVQEAVHALLQPRLVPL
jgi:hypothetical protein